MEINLKDKLRALRQQKHVTQEALAQHVGITPQSVGKWERGEGFPDITLLPKIACYFDVTVDELLDVAKDRMEAAIQDYERQSRVYMRAGEKERNQALWERAYAEFPNDCRVIAGLMMAINQYKKPCPKDEAERIISLAETLLQRSADTHQREIALDSLCTTYQGIGNTEKALYYADMAGSYYLSKEDYRARILMGEEGVMACQYYVSSLLHTAARTAACMTEKADLSYAEKIEVYQFAVDLLTRLYSDGNVVFGAYDLSWLSCQMAWTYAGVRDAANTLAALAESVRYAVVEATLPDIKKYTAPMVNRLTHSKANVAKNYKGNSCNLRLAELKNKQFDFVRSQDAFQNLKATLEKYAES